MRKIITIKERERKETRSKLVVGLVLVAIMILSSVGYAFYNTGREEIKKLNYGGIKFTLKEDNLWHFNIQGQEFSTLYNPEQIENISSFILLNIQAYAQKSLYFSYDSERQGINEINRNIGRFATRTQYVCLDNCTENWPIKDCSENIIIIKESGENLIKQENKCIYILGKESDLLRVSDAFIFRILGIS